MHQSVLDFAKRILTRDRVAGKFVLEVGSYNVNGSVRDLVEDLKPASYLGVDIEPQDRFVDRVASADRLVEAFGSEAFDIVISTELMEHVANWSAVVDQMRQVLRPGGLLLMTTRSPGFPLHGYPSDHWRYSPDDLGCMFADYRPIYLGDDHDSSAPGVFYAGVKPPWGRAVAAPSPMLVDYHSGYAQEERMRLRKANPTPPTELKVFYHVACMGNWRQVFADQMALFDECGLEPRCYVLGSAEDYFDVLARCPDAVHAGSDLRNYETPTLQALYGWASENPGAAVLYCHTKGVSNPGDTGKIAWRILMEETVIRPWRENLGKLAIHDMVGLGWIDNPSLPHFSGNFWMARCDWIASLTPPWIHRNNGGPEIAGNPWIRMHAEMWLGHKFHHWVESLRCRNETLWYGDRVFELLNPAENARFEKFIHERQL